MASMSDEEKVVTEAERVLAEALRGSDVPKTDQEKIDWLWRMRDTDHAKIEELTTSLKRKDTQVQRFGNDNRVLQRRVDDLTRERDALVTEVNSARAAAASAVWEYIKSQEG